MSNYQNHIVTTKIHPLPRIAHPIPSLISPNPNSPNSISTNPQMERNPKFHREQPHDGGAASDRLTSLPENIIITILSLLPLKTAVSTSVLSRQWRHRWTHITNLTLSNFSLKNPNPNSYPPSYPYPNPNPNPSRDPFAFFSLIDHLFLELSSPDIHEFKFSVCTPVGNLGFNYGSRFQSHMQTWLRFLLRRNVKVIEISDSCSCHWFRLSIPPSVFTCRTLIELNLTAQCDYYPLPDDVNLPNLKKLDIMLDETHDELISKLFKGCPRLEESRLDVMISDESVLIQIHSMSLKSFVMKLGSELLFAIDVLIDAPNLEYLNISSNLVRYRFVSNPMALIRASIDFTRFDDEDNIMLFLGPILELLSGVSNARTICCEYSLIPCALSWMEGLCLPTFRNLTRLSLGLCCRNSWWALWGLLRQSPKLEVLSVRMSQKRCCREVTRQMALNPETVYLPDSMKKMHVVELGLNANELELIKYILGCLKNLELLTLALHNVAQRSKEVQLCKELEFCEKLSKFPRCSLGCQIHFDGTYIKISEDGIKVGELGNCGFGTFF